MKHNSGVVKHNRGHPLPWTPSTWCPRERLQAVALGGRWCKQHRSAKGSHLPCLPASAGGTAVRPRPLGHTQHTHLYTNPEQQTQYITFLCKEWIHTSAVHSLLLLLAGDIETNSRTYTVPLSCMLEGIF